MNIGVSPSLFVNPINKPKKIINLFHDSVIWAMDAVKNMVSPDSQTARVCTKESSSVQPDCTSIHR